MWRGRETGKGGGWETHQLNGEEWGGLEGLGEARSGEKDGEEGGEERGGLQGIGGGEE